MNVIHSCAHKIYTETINEAALSSEDDKRIILEDGIHTLTHGHLKLSQWNLFAFLDPNQRSGRSVNNFDFQFQNFVPEHEVYQMDLSVSFCFDL